MHNEKINPAFNFHVCNSASFFGEKSKCGVKVVSVDSDGNETVLEDSGNYSYMSDSFLDGKIFKLNATFRNAKTKRLRKIEWAYPASMNRTHTEFSISVYPDSTKKTRPAHALKSGVDVVEKKLALPTDIFLPFLDFEDLSDSPQLYHKLLFCAANVARVMIGNDTRDCRGYARQ